MEWQGIPSFRVSKRGHKEATACTMVWQGLELLFVSFNTIAGTIYEHYDEILNYFVNSSTNAFAQSFNAKIKAFRAILRGVTDLKFSYTD